MHSLSISFFWRQMWQEMSLLEDGLLKHNSPSEAGWRDFSVVFLQARHSTNSRIEVKIRELGSNPSRIGVKYQMKHCCIWMNIMLHSCGWVHYGGKSCWGLLYPSRRSDQQAFILNYYWRIEIMGTRRPTHCQKSYNIIVYTFTSDARSQTRSPQASTRGDSSKL
jgi:hypothetical protein